jgi:hypothetical protein
MRSLILIVFTLSCSAVSVQPSASCEKSGARGKAAYEPHYLTPRIESNRCTQARVRACFNGFKARLKPSTLTQARQIARSSLTQSLSGPSASASSWLLQLRRDVEAEVRAGDIDFSQMPVEDAMMLMFMLVSEDAEKDLKEMLNDMNETAKKKQALREKVSELKGHICRLIEQMEKGSDKGRRPN